MRLSISAPRGGCFRTFQYFISFVRDGLFELLTCDENLARLIATGACEVELIVGPRMAGTGMLLDDVAAKVIAGTIPETL